MNLTFVVVIWAVLGVATLVLAVYRLIFATHNEEDIVRLAPGEEGEVQKQAVLAKRLVGIDRWGVAMTVITAIMGLGLAGGFLYQAWKSPNPGPNNFYRMNSPAK
jgi:multisubunit Na+/H+ antiporter MnhF subunit